MSGTADRLEDTKTNIRGILESCKRPLSLQDFLRDYEDVVCEELPFRHFRYASAEAFLGSLYDTVILKRSHYGTMIECVTNDKSAHIQRLVRNQDTSKKTSKSGGSYRPFICTRRIRPQSRFSTCNQSSYSNSRPISSNSHLVKPDFEKTARKSLLRTPEPPVNRFAYQNSSRFAVSDTRRYENGSFYSKRYENASSDPKRYESACSDPKRFDKPSSDLKRSDYPSSDQKRSESVNSNEKQSENASSYITNERSKHYDNKSSNPEQSENVNSHSKPYENTSSNPKQSDSGSTDPKPLINTSSSAKPAVTSAPTTSHAPVTVESKPKVVPFTYETKTQLESSVTKCTAASSNTTQPKPVNNLASNRSKPPNYPPGFNAIINPMPVYPARSIPPAMESTILNFVYFNNGMPLPKFAEHFHAHCGLHLEPQVYGFTSLFEMLSSLPFIKFHNTGSQFNVNYVAPYSMAPIPCPPHLGIPIMEQYPHFQPLPLAMHPLGQLPFTYLSMMQQQHQQQQYRTMPMFSTPMYTQPPKQFVETQPSVVPNKVAENAAARSPAPQPKAGTPPPLSSPEISPPQPSTSPQVPFDSVSDYDAQSMVLCTPTPLKASIYISDEIKAVFRQILASKPTGLLLSKLPLEYKRISNKALDFEACGCYSILELVGCVPDVFKMKRNRDGTDWILMKPFLGNDDAADSGRGSESRTSFVDFSRRDFDCVIDQRCLALPIDMEISPLLRRRIMKIVCSCQSGVCITDFERIYKAFFSEEFKLDSPKAFSLESMFLSLSDIVYLNYLDNGKIMIHELPEGRNLLRSACSKTPPPTKKSPVIPNDVADNIFNEQTLPSKKVVGDFIEVYISHVTFPSAFYVQLRGNDTSEALNTLMADISTMYRGKSADLYKMPESFIAVNRPCVAMYSLDGNWYRALILGIKNKETVEVYYVDFGNKASVSIASLRMIKKEFMDLPSQAILAHLTGCAPVSGSHWSKKATTRFRELVANKPIIAQIKNISNSISLVLCDTNGKDDVYIQDALICEDLARMLTLDNHLESLRMPKACQEDAFYKAVLSIVDSANQMNHVVNLNGSPTRDLSGSETTQRSVKPPVLSGNIIQNDGSILPFKMISHSLLDKQINVILINSDCYVPTFDISKFIWPQDYLRTTLMILRHRVEYFFIQNTGCQLYSILQSLQPDAGDSGKKIALCPLNTVQNLLEAVIKQQEKLRRVADAFRDMQMTAERLFS